MPLDGDGGGHAAESQTGSDNQLNHFFLHFPAFQPFRYISSALSTVTGNAAPAPSRSVILERMAIPATTTPRERTDAISSPFENASERLSALVNRAADFLEDIEDTPSPAERVMGAGSVEAEPLRLLREAIELNRAQLEAFREYSRRYDEELAEQRREAAEQRRDAAVQRHEAAVRAEQSRLLNAASLAIAALSLVFAIVSVFVPYIWPQP